MIFGRAVPNNDDVTVTFTIRDRLGARGNVRGRVGFGGAAVVLEFDAMDSPPAPARKVVIDVEEFAACTFRRGALGARMQLWSYDEGALGGVPGGSEDGVVLQFARPDRDAAEALARDVRTAIDDAIARTPERFSSTGSGHRSGSPWDA